MTAQVAQIEKKLPFARSFTDLSREEAQHFGSLAKEIGCILGSMLQDAESFRGEDYILKEEPSSYFVDATTDPLNTEY